MKILRLTFLASLFAIQATAQIPQSQYVSHRSALAKQLGNGILIALGSPEPEEDFLTFNQNSSFRYLTNFNEPGAALVMVIRNGEIVGSPLLFVEPSDPAREVWTGHRLGVPGVRTALGMEGRDASTLSAVVDSLASLDPTATLFAVGSFIANGPITTTDDQILAGFLKTNNRLTIKRVNNEVANLRRVKTNEELDF